jgi:hypothetical protein
MLAGYHPQVRFTLIGLLLLRAFQTWRSVVNAKSTMDDFVRTTLYRPNPNPNPNPDADANPKPKT